MIFGLSCKSLARTRFHFIPCKNDGDYYCSDLVYFVLFQMTVRKHNFLNINLSLCVISPLFYFLGLFTIYGHFIFLKGSVSIHYYILSRLLVGGGNRSSLWIS